LIEDIVIRLINRLLINTDNCRRLAKYSNYTMEINIQNLTKIAFIINHDGSITRSYTKTITNQIIIDNLYGVLSNKNYFDKLKFITINGDKKVVLDIMKILNTLDIYALYIPDNVISQVMLNNTIELLKKLLTVIKNCYDSLTYSMGEYLQYETDIIVTRYEVNQFCDDVDLLYQRYIKLSTQIANLEKKI
jgi:ubiquinone biosynthesis protein UbiJ